MSTDKNITFRDIKSDYVKETFLKTMHSFPVLKKRKVTLARRPLRHTTMQAQPIVDQNFFSNDRRRFRIDINDHTRVNRNIKVHELPEEVLTGWFAHEMGHLMDYLERGAFNLMGFGIGYLYFEYFRIGAERMADIFAIDHGFGAQIRATKKFILEESKLPDEYKSRIERFYMSPEEVELLLGKEPEEEICMDRPELRPWAR